MGMETETDFFCVILITVSVKLLTVSSENELNKLAVSNFGNSSQKISKIFF